MRVLISAADLCGEIAGAGVAKALTAHGVDVFGMGGDELQSADIPIVVRLDHASTVGLGTARGRVRRILSLACNGVSTVFSMREAVARLRPDAILMIGSPGLHLPLAQMVTGSRKVYLLPPELWAWETPLGGYQRASRLFDFVDVVVPGLRFEERLYLALIEQLKSPAFVRWVGHPVLDAPIDYSHRRATILDQLGLQPASRLVGLMPGSREAEVTSLLPTMLQAAAELSRCRPDLHFFLPIARRQLRPVVDGILRRIGCPESVNLHAFDTWLSRRAFYNLMTCCDGAAVASGTVALELAYVGVPSAVCYQVSWLDEYLARCGVLKMKTPYFALPNILLREEVCPEFVGRTIDPQRVAAAVHASLQTNEGDESARTRLAARIAGTGELGDATWRGTISVTIAQMIQQLVEDRSASSVRGRYSRAASWSDNPGRGEETRGMAPA